MAINLFAEAANAATRVTAPKLYGNETEYTEGDATLAYAEALNLAYSTGVNIHLIAEDANVLSEKLGVLGAVVYCEAEGGFFKRILDAIIKLFEKVKTFFKTILGRFKSNKSYRDDIVKLQATVKTITGYKFNDKAQVVVKSHAWSNVASLVKGILNKKTPIFETTYNGKTIGNIIESSKNVVAKLDGGTGEGSEIKTVTDTLAKISTDFNTVDAWTRHLYSAMVGTVTGSSKADFSKGSSMSPTEAINALWSADSTTLKGENIKTNAVAKSIFDIFTVGTATALDYDSMIQALEEGETFFTDKSNDLKEALGELDKVATRVNASTSDEAKNNKDVAGEAANISTKYSQVLSNYSTICLNAFNTGRLQLDKLISEAKTFINAVDKAREQFGNKDAEPVTK